MVQRWMARIKYGRLVVTGAAIALGVAAVAWGQAGQPPAAARTQMDEILAEVRGLRADLRSRVGGQPARAAARHAAAVAGAAYYRAGEAA